VFDKDLVKEIRNNFDGNLGYVLKMCILANVRSSDQNLDTKLAIFDAHEL
jgi:hypothetical protein